MSARYVPTVATRVVPAVPAVAVPAASAPVRTVMRCAQPNFYPGYRRYIAPAVINPQGGDTRVFVPHQKLVVGRQPVRPYHKYAGPKQPKFHVQPPNQCVWAAQDIAAKMKGIRELRWDELSWAGVVKRGLLGYRETVSVKLPETAEDLAALIKEHKVLVVVGENLTMTEEEGGKSKYTTHHAVVVFAVAEAEGKKWVFMVDPDDTVTHPIMKQIKEYAKARKKQLQDLTHAEIVEATGDASALVRRLSADEFLSKLPPAATDWNAPKGVFTVNPVSGVGVEEAV